MESKDNAVSRRTSAVALRDFLAVRFLMLVLVLTLTIFYEDEFKRCVSLNLKLLTNDTVVCLRLTPPKYSIC